MRERVPEVVGMFQREVAQRVASGPGNKDYGILSVLLQAWYDIKYEFTVDPIVFNPPPKVFSGVISLRRNSTTDLGCDERKFTQVVKARDLASAGKHLRNALKPLSSTRSCPCQSVYGQTGRTVERGRVRGINFVNERRVI